MFRRYVITAVMTLLVLGMPVLADAQRPGKAAKQLPPAFAGDRAAVAAISGLASSARHCIGPEGANTHSLGWVPEGTPIVVTFTSDFDPVASMTVVQLGLEAPDMLARASFVADDDGGGNLEPELRFRTTYAGTLVLHVGKFAPDRQAGCYHYRVEVGG